RRNDGSRYCACAAVRGACCRHRSRTTLRYAVVVAYARLQQDEDEVVPSPARRCAAAVGSPRCCTATCTAIRLRAARYTVKPRLSPLCCTCRCALSCAATLRTGAAIGCCAALKSLPLSDMVAPVRRCCSAALCSRCRFSLSRCSGCAP
ncbi:hypothetical protein Dimus_030804, partial [Dionaea muscipula]